MDAISRRVTNFIISSELEKKALIVKRTVARTMNTVLRV